MGTIWTAAGCASRSLAAAATKGSEWGAAEGSEEAGEWACVEEGDSAAAVSTCAPTERRTFTSSTAVGINPLWDPLSVATKSK